jgi:hypothetical protein
MKKILAIIGLAAVAVSSSYAQGLVFFNNQNNTRISTNSIDNGAASGVVGATAGTFYYALFYSTTQTTIGGTQTASVIGTNGIYAFNASGWNNSGLTATNSGATAGRFASNSSDAGNNSIAAGLPGVTAAQFVVIGWSSSIGSTIAALQAWLQNPTVIGYIGESAVSGAITTGNGGTQVTPAIMGISAPQIAGFTLGLVTPVPEPGTLALAALGGASLLLFRRKK